MDSQLAFSRPLQEFRHPLLENAHQGRIHEREPIRDVETHDALTLEVAFERRRQFFQVSLLHHEYDVGPLDELPLSGFSASLLRPAEATSTLGQDENTSSAVGLRSLFW